MSVVDRIKKVLSDLKQPLSRSGRFKWCTVNVYVVGVMCSSKLVEEFKPFTASSLELACMNSYDAIWRFAIHNEDKWDGLEPEKIDELIERVEKFFKRINELGCLGTSTAIIVMLSEVEDKSILNELDWIGFKVVERLVSDVTLAMVLNDGYNFDEAVKIFEDSIELNLRDLKKAIE